MKTILITGVCGFVFSNFLHYEIDKHPEYRFVGIDKAVRPHNLSNMFEHPNYKFYMADIADQHIMDNIFKLEKPDIIIHGAAESHVDNSITDIKPFLHSNVLGTQCLINSSLQYGVKKFIYISTDEVYGQLQLGEGIWTEEAAPRPRNPYSASKYAGELIVHAAAETHGLIYNITRSSNNYGGRQQPINLIPKVINCLLTKQPIPIHGDGKNVREWLYVLDNCEAIVAIIKNGAANEIYNIGSGIEKTNLEVVSYISGVMNIDPKINFVADRKGHDKRYSIDCSKIRSLGWRTKYNFDSAMLECINWYKNNRASFND